MATRMVTDCDRCNNENIGGNSHRLEVPTVGEGGNTRQRIDMDTKCLGAELQTFLSALTPEQGREWLARIRKEKQPKVKTNAAETA